MREYYKDKIEGLKEELECIKNQFNYISGTNINNKNIDILILRMNYLERQIESVYAEAKLRLM